MSKNTPNYRIRKTLIITKCKNNHCYYLNCDNLYNLVTNELFRLNSEIVEFTQIIYQCEKIESKDLDKLIYISKTYINCEVIICIPYIPKIYKQLFREIGIGIRESQKNLCEDCANYNELKELSIYYINNVLNIKLSDISYICQRALNLIASDIPNSQQFKIAQKLGISSDYLSLIIKKDTKINFRDFVNKLKLFLAKELLQNNEIWLVAEKLGFNEVNNFHRFFKKNEGITPLAFCKKFVQNTNLKY